MGRRTKLTPEVQTSIVKWIEGGAYDWVAAQNCGIHPATFRNWMDWGRKGNPHYIAFFAEVCRARAQARAIAEVEVRRDNPLAWLRYGPGRDRPNEPGWTESTEHKVNLGLDEETIEVILGVNEKDKVARAPSGSGSSTG